MCWDPGGGKRTRGSDLRGVRVRWLDFGKSSAAFRMGSLLWLVGIILCVDRKRERIGGLDWGGRERY